VAARSAGRTEHGAAGATPPEVTPTTGGPTRSDELPPLPPPHTRLGVGGVLIRNGRVLVNRAVYRERFTIPSGFVEPGETLARAVVRELEEETGVTARIGRLLLVRHKVVRSDESDVYFAFELVHLQGEPAARPPEIAEIREVPLPEVARATWISELSRLAIGLAARPGAGWDPSHWAGGEVPGLATETYHPGSE
jgi:ADP-ribose pyrophosphatase YjhB (NUDIX family)